MTDVTYEFRFDTKVTNPDTFLYNGGPITYDAKSGEYTNLNVVQTYTVAQDHDGRQGPHGRHDASAATCSPRRTTSARARRRTTSRSSAPAIHSFKDGTKVFAGQRDDPFFVDLGGTFDLLGFRSAPPAAFNTGGVDGLKRLHASTRSRIQVPIRQLTRTRPIPTDVNAHELGDRRLRLGVAPGDRPQEGHARAGSRSRASGNPLVNEVVIPLGKKDLWNRSAPADDKQFEKYYLKPELAGDRERCSTTSARPTTNRVDLTTVLLTGIPPKNGLGAADDADRRASRRRPTCCG